MLYEDEGEGEGDSGWVRGKGSVRVELGVWYIYMDKSE